MLKANRYQFAQPSLELRTHFILTMQKAKPGPRLQQSAVIKEQNFCCIFLRECVPAAGVRGRESNCEDGVVHEDVWEGHWLRMKGT